MYYLVLRLIDHKYSVLIRKSDQNVFTQSGLAVVIRLKQYLMSSVSDQLPL